MSSIAHRSNSTSATSAKSQATLVEIYPDLIDTKELAFEATYEVLPYLPPKNNLVNHLLEMFCIKWLNMSKGGSQVFHPLVSLLSRFRRNSWTPIHSTSTISSPGPLRHRLYYVFDHS
jgi:hypothetical protein